MTKPLATDPTPSLKSLATYQNLSVPTISMKHDAVSGDFCAEPRQAISLLQARSHQVRQVARVGPGGGEGCHRPGHLSSQISLHAQSASSFSLFHAHAHTRLYPNVLSNSFVSNPHPSPDTRRRSSTYPTDRQTSERRSSGECGCAHSNQGARGGRGVAGQCGNGLASR